MRHDYFITRRRSDEWQAEYELAQRVRPQERGGLAFQQATVEASFHSGLWRSLIDWFTLNSTERLIARNSDQTGLLASLWTQQSFGAMDNQLTLINDPQVPGAAEALLTNVARRWRNSRMRIEHPADDEAVSQLLSSMNFRIQHTLLSMKHPLGHDNG